MHPLWSFLGEREGARCAPDVEPLHHQGDFSDARRHPPEHSEYNGEQGRFLRDSLAGVAGVGEVPLMAAANPIDGEPLHAACLFQS